MKKLLLPLVSIAFMSCEPNDAPIDAAAQASGRFVVESYVVYGDTLYKFNSNKGKAEINKIGVSQFAITLNRVGPNQVEIESKYVTLNDLDTHISSKVVSVNETDYLFKFAPKDFTTTEYEASIKKPFNSFHERIVGDGLLIPLAGSKTALYTPSPQGIVIEAKRQ